MSYITILRNVRTSNHAVAANLFNQAEVEALVAAGLIQKGRRSCAGKLFTVDTKRPVIDGLIATTGGDRMLNILAAIKGAASSITIEGVARAINGNYAAVSDKMNKLKVAGLIKEHRSKRGYFFTNPEFRTLLFGMVGDNSNQVPTRTASPTPAPTQQTPAVPPVRVTTTNGYTLGAVDKAILTKLKNAPSSLRLSDVVPPASNTAEAGVSIGFLIGLGLVRIHRTKPGYYFTEPTKASVIAGLIAPPAPVVATPAPGAVLPTDAVLALCRLSEHGVSMNGIWAAFQKLITEGLIRADKRDTSVNSKDVRYFVRKGGPRQGDIRAKADARIAKLVAKNDNLVDLINEEVDHTQGF